MSDSPAKSIGYKTNINGVHSCEAISMDMH